jgi:hypothetical protein
MLEHEKKDKLLFVVSFATIPKDIIPSLSISVSGLTGLSQRSNAFFQFKE